MGTPHVKANRSRLPKSTATAPDLSARGAVEVIVTALEPALLPRSGVPAGGPPLARLRPARHKPNVATDPPPDAVTLRRKKCARQRAKTLPKALENPGVVPAWSRSRKFFPPALMRPAGLL